jgi:hypothetical protein
MTQQHPITPPPELVQQWNKEAKGTYFPPLAYSQHIANRAAQWGADQELEACCELVRDNDGYDAALALRADRRPKPPSLKEQALDALTLLCKGPDATAFVTCRDTIRRALEQLPDHE